MFNLQAAGEVKALEDFYKMLQHEPDRAFYGWVMMDSQQAVTHRALIHSH